MDRAGPPTTSRENEDTDDGRCGSIAGVEQGRSTATRPLAIGPHPSNHSTMVNDNLNSMPSPPSSRFAYLNLLPSTRQTTVKTVTTTTIHYAPIRIPRPPSPTLTGNYARDKQEYPLRLAENKEASRSAALPGRTRDYRPPPVSLRLGGSKQTKATLEERDEAAEEARDNETFCPRAGPLQLDHTPRSASSLPGSSDDKGKKRMLDGDQAGCEGLFEQRHRPNKRRRQDEERTEYGGEGGDEEEEHSHTVEPPPQRFVPSSTHHTPYTQRHHPPGHGAHPARTSHGSLLTPDCSSADLGQPQIDDDSRVEAEQGNEYDDGRETDKTAHVCPTSSSDPLRTRFTNRHVLPSPNLSPNVRHEERQAPGQGRDYFADAGEEGAQTTAACEGKVITAETIETTVEDHTTSTEQEFQQQVLGSGYELSTLMSLPSLVSEFSHLPRGLQTHVLQSLLRHTSVQVLQSINHLIQPALKRDFISDLPPELSLIVLQYLDHHDIVRALQVCKTWRRLINSQAEIWKRLLVEQDLWIGDTIRTEERETAMYRQIADGNSTSASSSSTLPLSLCSPPSHPSPRLEATAHPEDGLIRELSLAELLHYESEHDYTFTSRWRSGAWGERGVSGPSSPSSSKKMLPLDGGRPARAVAGRARSGSHNPRQHVADEHVQTLRRHGQRLIDPRVNSASPPPRQHLDSTVHPLKLVYKKRYAVRTHWHSSTNQPHKTTFSGQQSSVVTCLQFDREKIVTASDDLSIDIYDTMTGQRKMQLQGHQGGVWALQYIGDVLVSGSTDRSLRIWDLKTGKCTHVFEGHTSTVRCLQIVEPVNINPDPNGEPIWEPPYPLVVTGSRDNTLRVWRLPTAESTNTTELDYAPPSPSDEPNDPKTNPFHLLLLTGHRLAVRALAAHGRTLVSGSYDSTLRVWDLLTGECRFVLAGHTAKVYSVILDHERKQCASGSMDGTVRLWSTETGTALHRLSGHSSLVGLLGLSFHYLVSAGADSTLKLWNPSNGACIDTLAANAGAITCFKHNDFRIVSGSDGQLRVWDIRKGTAVQDILDNVGGVWQVQFNDRFAVAAVQRNGATEFEVLDFFPELRDDPEALALAAKSSTRKIPGAGEQDEAISSSASSTDKESEDDEDDLESMTVAPQPPTTSSREQVTSGTCTGQTSHITSQDASMPMTAHSSGGSESMQEDDADTFASDPFGESVPLMQSSHAAEPETNGAAVFDSAGVVE